MITVSGLSFTEDELMYIINLVRTDLMRQQPENRDPNTVALLNSFWEAKQVLEQNKTKLLEDFKQQPIFCRDNSGSVTGRSASKEFPHSLVDKKVQ